MKKHTLIQEEMDAEQLGSLKKPSSEQKLQLTVDGVIEKHVGSFGFSQLVQVFLVSLVRMFDSQSTMATIFTDAQPNSWRCIGRECSVGGLGSGGAASVCGLKPGTWEWSGGNASSTVAEWGLVCDRKFLAAMPTSLYFLGSLIGPPLPQQVRRMKSANRLYFLWSTGRWMLGKEKISDTFMSANLRNHLPYFPLPQHMDLHSSTFGKWVFTIRHGDMLPCALNRGCWSEMARSGRPIWVLFLCSRVPFSSLDCLPN